MKKGFLGIILSLLLSALVAQVPTVELQVTPTNNMTPLVNQLISGCKEILSVTASGNMMARGSFTNGTNAMGFDQGIILSTGKVADAATPNFNGSTAFNFYGGGDAVLTSALGYSSSTDASSITIQLIAQGDEMSLNYVFASEGYEFDYTNQGKPEGCGIFVSGPIPNDPTAAQYTNFNIATIPNSLTPICIDSVNSGINSSFFNLNTFGSYSMQYDGFTNPMTAVVKTEPCATYTVKIVVADFNGNFDSAIFLEGGSFSTDDRLYIEYQNTTGSPKTLYEGCEGRFVISRINQADSVPIPLTITFSGAAIELTDYNGMVSGPYLMGANMTFMNLDFLALIDNITEGNENLIMTITHPDPCNSACDVEYVYEIDIIDNYDLVAGITQNDTNICAYSTSFLNLTTFIPSTIDPQTVSYLWNNGATTANLSAQPTAGSCTDYYVTITDICSQVVTDSIRICNSNFMSINVGTIDNLCHGETKGSVIVIPNGGFLPITYSWTPSTLGASTSGIINNMPAGNYGVTVTDSVGCYRASNFVIDQPDSIYYAITAYDPLCHNQANGSVLMQVFNGVPPYSFNWSNGESTSGINNLGSGVYAVTATDYNECTLIDTVELINPEPLWLGVSNDTWACKGKNTSLSAWAIGGTPAYFYSWSNGASGPNITVNPTENSIFSVQAHDINGCLTDVRIIEVSVYPDITLELVTLHDSICLGDSTIIHAQIVGGTGGPYYVEIFDGASTEILPPPYTVLPNATTTYAVAVQDFCNLPPAEQSLTVYVFEGPDVQMSADIIQGCQPLTVQFDEHAAPAGSTYHWNFGESDADLLADQKATYHVYENDGLFDISLEVTSPIGCKTILTEPRMIEVFPNPVASFYPSPAIVSILKPIIYFQNTSLKSDYNTWNFGDGTESSNAISPEHYFSQPGEYIVELQTETAHGCMDTYFQKIIVQNQYTFYVPNAIDPHSSIVENRNFGPSGEGISLEDFHMVIFDRWGHKVFETFNLNRKWDGSVGNEVKPGQSYTWIISYKDLNGQSYSRTGVVTIIN